MPGFKCVPLVFESQKLGAVANGTAKLTVCNVTLTVRGGATSTLVQLSGGGVGASAAMTRRRSIATNASLVLEFDSALAIASVTLLNVDMGDAGTVDVGDAAATRANVTANVVDTSSAGVASTVTIAATAGNGFTFVKVDAALRVPAEAAATTTMSVSATTTNNASSVALLPPSPEMWGPLVWYYWIIIACSVVLCIAILIVVIYCVVKNRDDDQEDEYGWEMESATRGYDGPEMTSARAYVDDEDDDPNMEFRRKRLSLTPAAAAALNAPDTMSSRSSISLPHTNELPPMPGTLLPPNGTLPRPGGTLPRPGGNGTLSRPPPPPGDFGSMRGSSMGGTISSPAPFLPPPPAGSQGGTMKGEDFDQYQALPPRDDF